MATVFIRQPQVPVIFRVDQQERTQSPGFLLDLELDCNIENPASLLGAILHE